jgi:hypothetical protein
LVLTKTADLFEQEQQARRHDEENLAWPVRAPGPGL